MPFEPFLHAREATEFPKPYVKWACEPARAEDVPVAIARAYYTAMQAPCGPTFVSVPVDDWDRSCEPIPARQVSRIVRGDPTLLAQAADALGRAKKPALVVGAGVARDGAWNEVIELAERHEAAVWVSPMSGRNSFPEDHRLFAGFLGADRARVVVALAGHDLVVVLGAPVFTYHVEGNGPHVPEGASLIQLVDDPSMAAWAPLGTAIVTSLRAGLTDLLANGRSQSRSARAEPAKRPVVTGERLTDAYLLQQVALLRPRHSIIVEEAPSSRGAMHDHLPIVEPDSFFTCASGGLGFGLPAALGIAMARPERKVIAVLGDGSSMYSIQALWSAAQQKLPIAFVVIKNGTYEALNEFGRHFGIARLPGVSIPDIDFCGLARGQGVSALRVAHAGELDEALRTAFASTVPMLVEVTVEVPKVVSAVAGGSS